MPLTKVQLRPGVNRENTRYTTEGGWFESDKVRFRQGTPEKIGGWVQLSANRFLGVCRSLWSWSTLSGVALKGVGTNLKFYIERGGQYFDITPLRETTAAGDVTFSATDGSDILEVLDTGHGATEGSFVTFSGAVDLGGNVTAVVLNQEYQIASVINANSYRILLPVTADALDTGDGGTNTIGRYQLNVGPDIQVPLSGWGAGAWGLGAWGIGAPGSEEVRLWNQSNYGEDLIFGPRGGGLYLWDATTGVGVRGVNIAGLVGASDVPVVHTKSLVSDVSRFVLCFGVNEIGSSVLDPMLIRWSDQEQFLNWTPAITNQAGGLSLSLGSKIVTAVQTRQEILVFTDLALYSLQYQGPPYVWGAQTMADNISIMGPNAVAVANNMTFWMGEDKFYVYNGQTQTLRCDLRQFIFQSFNFEQRDQVVAGVNEAFNEIWWWYPSAGSTVPDRYVVYNYAEDIWYYGNLTRTAWIDSAQSGRPVAAYSDRLLVHETGVDDGSNGVPVPIPAYITSSQFDIQDGDKFGFVWRVLPDITFRGSTANNPQAVMTLLPLQSSGSGYNDPLSVAGTASAPITRTAVLPIEAFTGIIYTRVRGRQMSIKIESTGLGTTWQLGSPRIDVKLDGKR
jgi:hypothetical protein